MDAEQCCEHVSVNVDAVNPYVGPQGFSPKIEVEKTETGHLVTVTDAEGEKSFEIADGIDGKNGVSPKLPEISYASSLNYTITKTNQLATTGSLFYMLNRENSVTADNTYYTRYMARGMALYFFESTPAKNGEISWTYG